ncbi:MAG: YggS family pyridoxal phosphate-dependent enzyme [Firmicutes bacterium]|nr:YggS family pyridoxal phosphate-dependent enzyme [Bacillota bacterium]
MDGIRANVARIRDEIAAAAESSGRTAEAITLVAVSKTVEPIRIQAAIEAGIRHLGENRVQEAQEKVPLIHGPVTWHMVGHLQRNKAGQAVELFDMIQSVDSKRLAEALSRRALQADRIVDVLVEVNVGGEASKIGISPEETESLIEDIKDLPGISVRGLMTIPPYDPNPEKVRPYFRRMHELFQRLKDKTPTPMVHLSMGMSSDFAVAIEEGATMVRVGTAIFGARDQ